MLATLTNAVLRRMGYTVQKTAPRYVLLDTPRSMAATLERYLEEIDSGGPSTPEAARIRHVLLDQCNRLQTELWALQRQCGHLPEWELRAPECTDSRP